MAAVLTAFLMGATAAAAQNMVTNGEFDDALGTMGWIAAIAADLRRRIRRRQLRLPLELCGNVVDQARGARASDEAYRARFRLRLDRRKQRCGGQ